MARAAAIAGLLAATLTAAPGCTTIAGVNDLQDWPCDEPCGDGAIDDSASVLDSGNDSAREAGSDSTNDVTTDVVTTDVVGDALVDVPVDVAETAADAAPDVIAAVDATDAVTTCNGSPATLVSLGGYSIDRTEVTNAQYAAFLAASPSVTAQDAWCVWNVTFTPVALWPATTADCDRPVANVDWCDAAAYCKWAGKRLCGHPISGAVPYGGSAFVTAASDAWYNACSSNGANDHPYPGVYVPKFCNDANYDGKLGTKPVATLPNCRPTTSPYSGVYDLTGNVAEWQDSCEKTAGVGDKCRVRGGDFTEDGNHASCTEGATQPRSAASAGVGFRCCSR